MKKTLRIAITGPESTGKSMLCQQLAAQLGQVWVPEYARDYIDGLNRDYNQQDILAIAKGQLALEEESARLSPRILFCDTDLLVTKIWSLHKYGNCDPWILEQIQLHRYDFYLLCNVDLPWEYDKQREHPHLREFFFEWYQRELQQYGFAHGIVSGHGDQRLQRALNLIEHLIT
ncbi:MAG: AAA family ATPase [Bacteroidales bacterium]